jgi:signal transduction histidine kinase
MSTYPVMYRASELIREQEERHRAWLHDNVLQVLEYVATGGYGECVDTQRLMAIAARAADDLRQVIDDEPRERRDDTFVEQIHRVVDEARALAQMEVRLDLRDFDGDVDPAVGGEVVAVVREALTNARKHSGARIVMVQCIADDDSLEVRVVDDGQGFDPLSVREGIGIRCSMRQRMARCGGFVSIASAPGRGAVVRITADTHTGVRESVA